jgi:hypothetical protein
MIKNYFRATCRNLLYSKNYFFLIAAFSICLWSTILTILYVKDDVNYDPFHEDVKQVYCIDKENIAKDAVASLVKSLRTE